MASSALPSAPAVLQAESTTQSALSLRLNTSSKVNSGDSLGLAVEAMAKVSTLRTGLRKLNLVAASIRGLKVQRALNELEFSHKRIAKDVRKALYSAISNAENNHNLDVDSLVVAEAWVGKNLVMKRWMPNARGRVGHIQKFFSELTIIVREVREESKEAA